MSGGIQQQRQMVEQLRREASNKRIPLSQTVEDIKVLLFLLWKCPSPFTSLSAFLSDCYIRITCFNKSNVILTCWFCQRFVLEHNSEDFLLHGFQGKNANPYRFLILHESQMHFGVLIQYCVIDVFGSLAHWLFNYFREKSSCAVLWVNLSDKSNTELP